LKAEKKVANWELLLVEPKVAKMVGQLVEMKVALRVER